MSSGISLIPRSVVRFGPKTHPSPSPAQLYSDVIVLRV